MISKISLGNKIFLIFTSIFLVSIGFIGFYGYKSTSDVYSEYAFKLSKSGSEALNVSIHNKLKYATEDVLYLNEFYALERFLIWKSMSVDQKSNKWKRILSEALVDFLETKADYYQARVIDVDGMELIVTTFDKSKNKAMLVEASKLQNKSNKDYVKNAINLNRGEYYISEFNLNMEYGKISKQIIPVIRYSTPIINSNGELLGVFVLNAFADPVLEMMKSISLKNKDIEYYLIDKDGNYIFNNDETKRWGAQLDAKPNFNDEYFKIKEFIGDKLEGTFIHENKIFSFNKLYHKSSRDDNYWYIISSIDTDIAFKRLYNFKIIFILILVSIILFSFFTIRHYLDKITTPLGLVSQQLKALSKGEIKKENINYSSEDEISEIVDSSNILINAIDRTIKQAYSIAKGDLSSDVVLLGKKDKLGLSMIEMTSRLRDISKQANAISNDDFSSNIEVKSRDDDLGHALWTMTKVLQDNFVKNKNDIYFSDGIRKFSDKLIGITDTIELSTKSISTMCRYVKANAGVVYQYNNDTKMLAPIASFSVDSDIDSYAVGQGSVGQVAQDKDAILLENVQDTTYNLKLATAEISSKTIFIIPLLHEGVLFGVVEIMRYKAFKEIDKTYLLRAADIFTSVLFSVTQSTKMKSLFEDSKKAYEELKESSIQMEIQQEQLTLQSRELTQKNNELLSAKEDLDKRAFDLERANKYKNEFLANMSHELRTPLNSIILLSKLLSSNKNNTLDENDVSKTNVIHTAGQNLLELINGILDLSKIESGNIELDESMIASYEITQEIRGLFSDLAIENGVEFIITDNFKSKFLTDKTKLLQVIKNLLSNAFKFTRVGKVSFSIDKKDNKLFISVKDSGIGIPADKLELIFEEFKQADGSTSREYGGTGLGLSISKRFVKLMGGSIDVQSKSNDGSVFTVEIPLVISVVENKIVEAISIENTNNNSDDEVIEFDSNMLDGKNILIVDDDSKNIFTLSSALQELGADTQYTLNGEEAIELLKESSVKIDLVLMDIMMPVMDGLDAIKMIKSDDNLKDIPIIVVTVKDTQDTKDTCFELGVDEYLVKPISHNELIMKIKDIV